MANEPGYLVPRDSYKRLGDVVRRVERTPINGMQPRPRKAPRFLPGAGQKLWQAVYPMRLRVIDPEQSSSVYDPIALSIPAGVVDGEPMPLSNETLSRVRVWIRTASVFDAQGILRRSALDELNADSGFIDLAGGEVSAIGCRYTNYVGTGDIFAGSDSQAGPGSGKQVLTVTIDEVLTSNNLIDLIYGRGLGRLYLAHVDNNTPAVSASVAFTTISDYLILHDSPDSAVMREGDTAQAFRERFLWLSDDHSYSPSAWVRHNERGWLPVLESIRTIPNVLGKARDGGGFAGNVVEFTVQKSTSDGKGNEEDSETKVFAYVRRGFVMGGRSYHLIPICPAPQLTSSVTLEVANPEMRFRGTATADIAQDDYDYVQIQRRSSDGGYSTPNMDQVIALNDLDFDVANGSTVEVVEDGGVGLWRIVWSDYTCPGS
jgi:hypothetical protein